jgi:hypothetical protein
MAAKYVLAALAVFFVVAALGPWPGGRRASNPQRKTWLLVAAIFSAVSAWLWLRA